MDTIWVVATGWISAAVVFDNYFCRYQQESAGRKSRPSIKLSERLQDEMWGGICDAVQRGCFASVFSGGFRRREAGETLVSFHQHGCCTRFDRGTQAAGKRNPR